MAEFCVYRHTSPSGKVYIGITGQNPLRRWNSGRGYKNQPHMFSAILKYGWDNFTHEILFDGLTQEEAEEQEIRLIAEHRSTDPAYGYNHCIGGHVNRGNHQTPERRAQISIEVSMRPVTTETREKLRRANLGKRHSEASKAKMRDAKLGKKLTEETCAKMRESNRGKRNKPVFCVELAKVFYSMDVAEQETGVSHENIAKVCKGKRNTAGGYHWEYYDAGRFEHCPR